MATPKYDLIVFGATSFVGQILARYLVERYGVNGDFKWAAAGRSQTKLEEVRSALGPQASALPLLTADASDEAALRNLCAQTRVVVSTVGPYALYGEPLVKVCAQTGTDYCDLTGEVQWVDRMIEKYEKDAKASGARIVHCCGFDSIPSDLGVFQIQQEANARLGKPLSRIRMGVKAMKGGASGGTVASMLNVVQEALKDSTLRKKLTNPYLLCPPKHPFSLRQPDVRTAQYDAEFSSWLAPFIMAGINTRVVHRSNALLNAAYGVAFQYDEAMLTGSGVKGAFSAWSITGVLGSFMASAAIKPTRWMLERFVLPKPGEGPSPEAQKRGYFDLRFRGQTEDGQKLTMKVTGDADPGYGSTAKMLGEAAACLASDIRKEDKAGGFWTPATIFGERLVERLQKDAGLKFEVIDQVVPR
jgi:short subunit dehydrogenase-like uncharacterized protein